MPRGHHLSDYETNWSKTSLDRNEKLKKCSKQSKKFHPSVPPIIIDPYCITGNAYSRKQHSSSGFIGIEAMPESEVSSTTFNYVISEDQLPITARTVDLKPAKSIAISNMSRITGVLRRAQEIDCRSSILYNSNRFQEDPESVRQGIQEALKVVL